ncbi:MAG: heparin lyase I family protein, partial [Vicinamibacterales bacterium]
TWPTYDQKIAVMNLTDSGGARRYQVIVNVTQGSYVVQHTDIDAWRFYNLDQNVGAPVTVRFDQWDKLKLHVRLNTPGQSNGIVRLWVNDQLKLDRTNVNIRAGTSLGLNKLIVGSYSNPPHNGPGVQWIDEVRLASTDPDAGTLSPPAAPTNVRIVSP